MCPHLMSGWWADYSLTCQPVDYSDSEKARRVHPFLCCCVTGRHTDKRNEFPEAPPSQDSSFGHVVASNACQNKTSQDDTPHEEHKKPHQSILSTVTGGFGPVGFGRYLPLPVLFATDCPSSSEKESDEEYRSLRVRTTARQRHAYSAVPKASAVRRKCYFKKCRKPVNDAERVTAAPAHPKKKHLFERCHIRGLFKWRTC
ncbi:hypothetical protein EVAR_85331_1 [Eumeta japonica]|uniref:Uncharacterized protein n=1 Tax=Eumeta variegata TaxID=151549 RepID=A0A4C1WUX6_EUMVA|nr:hypothetical protein EVAR_85331_1 [Eumeta japonica]